MIDRSPNLYVIETFIDAFSILGLIFYKKREIEN